MSRLSRFIVGIVALVLMQCAAAVPASAASAGLRVAPLHYDAVLGSGEKKQGVIDIANPSNTPVGVTVNVQAFKQVNSKGELAYYDDAHIEAGIIPDLREFTLEPHETERMAFLLDGTKLPTGDSFGAILFSTKPAASTESTGSVAAVRLGVLFTLQNGTPSEHHAEVTGVSIPFWQFDGGVKGSYVVKNTGDPAKSSGFFPEVSITLAPFDMTTKHRSTLVFPDIARSNDFSLSTGRFGFYRVTVGYGDSAKSSLVFIASPGQLAGLLLGLVAAGFAVWYVRKKVLPRRRRK